VTLGCVVPPQPAYPWRLELQVEYRLSPEGLAVTATATNLSDGPAPFGIGFHPYLTVGAPLDEAFLTVPAGRRMATDDRGLPTTDEAVDGTPFDPRTRRAICATTMDTCFTDLVRDDDGAVRVGGGARRARRLGVAGRGFDLTIYTGTLSPRCAGGEMRRVHDVSGERLPVGARRTLCSRSSVDRRP
jgi:aldose 1-epimerase